MSRVSLRTLVRFGVLVVCALPFSAVGLPAAQATDPTVTLTLAQGESASLGRLVANTDVTPVSTCDPQLSVSFDADMNGTVTVAPDADAGTYTCTVDFQIAGQPTGLVENVVVTVIPSCVNNVCLFAGTGFTGTAFNAGFPGTTCVATPFPVESVNNDIIFHVEFYQDSSCHTFDVEVQAGTTNPDLPVAARSYQAFICGVDC